MKNIFRLLAVLTSFAPLFGSGQAKQFEKNRLSFEVKYADVNDNDSVSVQEATVVFEEYLSNPAKNMETDLTKDVECVLIDLISYLETINCAPVKRTPATKRFIELYYIKKIKSHTNIAS